MKLRGKRLKEKSQEIVRDRELLHADRLRIEDERREVDMELAAVDNDRERLECETKQKQIEKETLSKLSSEMERERMFN